MSPVCGWQLARTEVPVSLHHDDEFSHSVNLATTPSQGQICLWWQGSHYELLFVAMRFGHCTALRRQVTGLGTPW